MKSKDLAYAELLLLSNNEIEILELLQKESGATPASLSKQCRIPRPTIYITLDKLKARGLVQHITVGKRKIWKILERDVLQEKIEKLTKVLIPDKTDYSKINLTNNTDITVYRGKKIILNLFSRLIENHRGKRLLGIQGDFAGEAWKHMFSVEDINGINVKIKEEGLITEIITSSTWLERQIDTFGKSWAENFGGRAAEVHFINHKYLNYKSQIFIFGKQLYLVSMKDEIFIEIKNQEISQLIISLLKFIEDHSSSVDINTLLKDIANKKHP